MATESIPFLSPEDYLRIDRAAEAKSEYYGGQMYAMSGGTPRHSRISVNTTVALDSLFRGSSCTTFNSDLRIHIPATGLYTYADCLVVCGELQLLDDSKDTLLNPSLLVEVLSPSTQDYDRGTRFLNYRSIPSLREYLVISQDRILVEQYLFVAGHWVLTEHTAIDQGIEMFIPDSRRLALSKIYYGIDFSDNAANS